MCGLRDRFVEQQLRDGARDAIGCRHVPGPVAHSEAETNEQRVSAGCVHVRMDGERAELAQLGRDLVRVDIGDERGLDWRSDGGRRFEAELHLPPARHHLRRHRRGRCREVLVRGRQTRHEAPELEIPEQFEHGGAVVGRPARAVQLESHRQIRHDRGELAAAQDLILVRGERLA